MDVATTLFGRIVSDIETAALGLVAAAAMEPYAVTTAMAALLG